MREAAGRGRILVTGGSGQVGGALVDSLAPLGEVVAPNRTEMDLADADSVRRAMRELKPRWVMNAGAYTAVDEAESHAGLAQAVNAVTPGVIGEEARAIGAAVVHFSTDYVFDGSKQSPYVETDPTGPLNVYGRTKLEGERALAASGAAHIIFRTSWVYGVKGKNFAKSILRMAYEREELRVVADQYGAPTWSEDLARMTALMIERLEAAKAPLGLATNVRVELREVVGPVSGVYHATASGETTWFGFAQAIVEEVQRLEPGARLVRVEAISTEDHATTTRRPANSRLDCTKLERAFGCRMPEWRESIRPVVERLHHAL